MEERLRNLTIGKAFLIGVVLALGYYFGMYNDGHNLEQRITAVQGEITKNRAQAEELRKVIKDAESFQQTMHSLGEEMEMVLRAIPSKLSSFELMKILSEEAKNVSVQIMSIKAP